MNAKRAPKKTGSTQPNILIFKVSLWSHNVCGVSPLQTVKSLVNSMIPDDTIKNPLPAVISAYRQEPLRFGKGIMKNNSVIKILVVMSSLAPFASFAGQIVNANTGEFITITADATQGNFTIDGSHASLETRTVAAASFNHSLVNRSEPDGHLMSLSYGAYTLDSKSFGYSLSSEEPDVTGIMLGYILPVTDVLTIGANIIDVIALPVKLPLRLIKSGQAKHDTDLIRRVVFANENVTVNSSKFQRLKAYLF